MDQAELECKVIEIVAKYFEISKEKVTSTTDFLNDLSADSLDVIELVMELEDGLDIAIPDEVIEKIKTVGNVVTYAGKVLNKA